MTATVEARADEQADEQVDGRAEAWADEQVDAAIAALAVPVRRRQLTRLTTAQLLAGAVAVVAALVAAIAAAARATAPVGRGTAHCGIDVWVYGYPDHAAASTCRHLEAGRTVAFVLAAAVAVVALALATAPLLRPRRFVVAVVGVAGVTVALLALRPATAELETASSVRTLHCGLDTYLWGYADPLVQHACRHAYGSHVAVLIPAVLVVVAVAGGMLAASGRRVLVRGLAVAAFAVLLVAAVHPVSVAVNDRGSAVMASCGLDSAVAGYPDHAVEAACRSHVDDHLFYLGALILLGIVGAVAVRKEAFS